MGHFAKGQDCSIFGRMKRFILFLIACLAIAPAAKADCVVLLHGLARSHYSLTPMAEALGRAGYRTVNQSYPSTSADIHSLVQAVDDGIAACALRPKEKLHFVTHSMGGILLRMAFADGHPPQLGRVVMLAPPNRGSELVDALKGFAPFDWVNGPAGRQLGTDAGSTPLALPPVDFDLGVIAGSHSFNPLYSSLIPGRDDGKVSIESTKVKGMRSHLTLPVTHSFMMMNPVVMAQTLLFLREGRFDADLTLTDVVKDWVLP